MSNGSSRKSSIKTVEQIDWVTWKAKEEAVLCFIKVKDHLLLIHKKTGLGKGKINAPGGRIEPNETAMEAAIRETYEETGLHAENLELTAYLSFVFTDGYSLHGTVFFASSFSGSPIETPEAKPFWCPLSEIPYDQMWQDDRLWLPLTLAGKKINGYFIFDDDTMLSYRIVPIETTIVN